MPSILMISNHLSVITSLLVPPNSIGKFSTGMYSRNAIKSCPNNCIYKICVNTNNYYL